MQESYQEALYFFNRSFSVIFLVDRVLQNRYDRDGDKASSRGRGPCPYYSIYIFQDRIPWLKSKVPAHPIALEQ